MLGSAVLDVAIGIIFVYLLVSILCAAVREGIEGLLKSRAAYLEYGIRELLHDLEGDGLATSFFEHPLIHGLYLDSYRPQPAPRPSRWRPWDRARRPPLLARGSGLPSYIPSRNFAVALMDLAARGRTTDWRSSAPVSARITTESIRRNVLNLRNEAVQRALLAALDTAGDDLAAVQAALEAWYDSAMDRVSGWYKRSSQWIILWVGLAAAVAFNVNTLAIADYLYHNDTAREALVARAEAAARDTTLARRQDYVQARAALDSLSLPIGWDGIRVSPRSVNGASRLWSAVFLPILGWLMTALAATLGAPFWFDVLNKVMVIRSTVKPREKSQEEGSEDRRPTTEGATRVEVEAAPPAPRDGEERPGTPLPEAPPPPPPPPPEVDPGDPERFVDACEVEMTDETPDDELPRAEGGVA